MIYLIPNGPKNLAELFPAIDWQKVDEYYVEAYDHLENHVATTPINKIGCCCTEDKVRIHFLNYLGSFDAVNFELVKQSHTNTSSQYKRSLSIPLLKTSTGAERFNVRSNESFIARTKCYQETNYSWCMELLDSPKAFLEWKGTQGQDDSFLPIVILDAKFDRDPEDHTFVFTVEYKLGNEKIIIRN